MGEILEDGNGSKVGKAISWNGEYSTFQHDDVCWPSDEDFKDHFEGVLNPPGQTALPQDGVSTNVNIPILDEPISPAQVQDQIRMIKPDQVCRPARLTPGCVLTVASPVDFGNDDAFYQLETPVMHHAILNIGL